MQPITLLVEEGNGKRPKCSLRLAAAFAIEGTPDLRQPLRTAAHWAPPQLIPIVSFHGRVARAHRESLLVVCKNVRNRTNLPRARCLGEWLAHFSG
jgi:hypothetical protein